MGSEVSQYKILPTPLDLLQVTHISFEFLTNQEPVKLVQRNFSHSICFESFLYIGRNWREIFPDLNTIKDRSGSRLEFTRSLKVTTVLGRYDPHSVLKADWRRLGSWTLTELQGVEEGVS